jgi:hypothetical protein
MLGIPQNPFLEAEDEGTLKVTLRKQAVSSPSKDAGSSYPTAIHNQSSKRPVRVRGQSRYLCFFQRDK